MSPTHVQIVNWLLANPEKPLAACAAQFGYTQSWLSQVIHSDCFQAYLEERQIELFGDVRLSVRDRIIGLAHESLRRLAERVAVEPDLDKINNAADTALKALGYGAKPAMPSTLVQQQQVVVGTVDAKTLAAARELMHRARPEALMPLEAVPALCAESQQA